MDLSFFDRMEPHDVLLIDFSRLAKIRGDVNYVCLEILPRLKPGALVRIHDILLPLEYPRRWLRRNIYSGLSSIFSSFSCVQPCLRSGTVE